MKLQADVEEYDVEPIGEIVMAGIWSAPPEENPGAYLMRLMRVSADELGNLKKGRRKNHLGRTSVICHDPVKNKLTFWPPPKSDTEALIEFFPPMRQL